MKMTSTNTNPKNYKVSGGNIAEEEKGFLIQRLFDCYTLARKNKLKGMLSSSSYSCCLVLDDNSYYFGINFNNTRNEISSLCAERMATVGAYLSQTSKFKEGEKFQYKIKYILIASYRGEGIFYEDRITPCADCLSWFNADSHIASDTKIVSFKKDEKGEIYLDLTLLESYLPLRNLSFDIAQNPKKVIWSKKAKNSNIKESEILNLYNKTYDAYKNNNFAKTTGQNIASSALINGEIFTGLKVDFSKRWFIEPLKIALYKGIEKFGDKIKISALCYVGDEFATTENGQKNKDGLISLQALGRINIKFADENTLIVTSSKDTVEVRTIGEFMPSNHKFIHDYKIQ